MTKRSPDEIAVSVLPQVMALKYGAIEQGGWGPRVRSRFNYRTPDDWYEAFLFEQVTGQTEWLDVGCGHHIFPHNYNVAKILAERCRLLVGVDPSDNIDDNPLVHQRAKCVIEDFKTDLQFDLITLRMVAEHISNPKAAVLALSRLTKPGGLVVIYTVWKWAPVSITAKLTPMSVHHAIKRVLWNAEERDTFPVEYQMNTRGELSRLFGDGGFREESFYYLDDCRTFNRFRILSELELTTWWLLRKLGLPYPESNILATYRKV